MKGGTTVNFDYIPAFGADGNTSWNFSKIDIIPLDSYFADPVVINYQGETNPLENDTITENSTDPYGYYYVLTGAFVYKLEGTVSFADGIYCATYTKTLVAAESTVTKIHHKPAGVDGPTYNYEWSDGVAFADVVGKRFGELITDGSAFDFTWQSSKIVGTSAAEVFHLGSDDDRIDAKGGDDRIFGDSGYDLMRGGAGADTFAFVSVTDSSTKRKADLITDFGPGKDKIDLEAIDAREGGKDQAFDFLGEGAFSGKRGELIFEQEGQGKSRLTQIYADVDGDGKADLVITLDGKIDLTATDFVL